jgi:hypothetical protein
MHFVEHPKKERGTMKIGITLCAFIVMLTGCSVPLVAEHSAALDRTEVCCNSFGEIQSQPLVMGTESRTEISTKSFAFKFMDGKSYFLAYRLSPSKATVRKLTIRTFAVNTTPITAAHIFIPRITTLDTNMKPVRSVTPMLELHRPRVIGESWWQGEISLTPSEAHAVVHTGMDERKIILRMPDSDAGAVYAPMRGGGGILIPNSRGYRLIPAGPTGEIAILLGEESS